MNSLCKSRCLTLKSFVPWTTLMKKEYCPTNSQCSKQRSCISWQPSRCSSSSRSTSWPCGQILHSSWSKRRDLVLTKTWKRYWTVDTKSYSSTTLFTVGRCQSQNSRKQWKSKVCKLCAMTATWRYISSSWSLLRSDLRVWGTRTRSGGSWISSQMERWTKTHWLIICHSRAWSSPK